MRYFLSILLTIFLTIGCSVKNSKNEIIALNIFSEITLPSRRMLRRTKRLLEKISALLNTYPDDHVIDSEELFSHINRDAWGWNEESIEVVRDSIERHMRTCETAKEMRIIVDIIISK